MNCNREQLLAAAERIAGGLAHDLRNPLSVVRNTVFVLRRRLPPAEAERLAEYLDIIERETMACGTILKELVDALQGVPPQRRPVDLEQMIAAARGAFAAQDRIEWAVAAAGLQLEADPAQLAQVFRHLFRNAIQAMGGSGRLSIEACRRDGGDEIRVGDTGPGIPADQLEQVFEPLFSTRPRRVGLGLTLSRRIVEQHGGTLCALPHEGGAMLLLQLPRK